MTKGSFSCGCTHVIMWLLFFCFVLYLQVWRVEWNVTGTILASSGDDGRVRLWKGTVYKLPCLTKVKKEYYDGMGQVDYGSG